MCTHANPITNVTTKERISERLKRVVNKPIVRAKKAMLEDENRSFMEMSIYRIRKYLKQSV